MLPWLLLLAFAALIRADAFHPDVILRLNEQVISPDCTPRVSTVINGSLPGPELRFKAGSHVWIRVYNDHETQNATVHYHGLTQYMAPFADGTPMSAQWPIAPRRYFDYEIFLERESVGTYFYHSHIGLQTVTAFGALIVEEPEDQTPPYEYDEERTLIFSDYFHANDSAINKGILDEVTGLIGPPFQWVGVPETLLVNGQGPGPVCNASALQPGQQCSTNSSYGLTSIEPDKTYRIRVIAAQGTTYQTFAIQGHEQLSLIEADGNYVQAYNTSHIEISSGQRYSFLLKSKSAVQVASDGLDGQYWLSVQNRYDVLRQGYHVLSYSTPLSPITTPLGNIHTGVTLPNGTLGWIVQDLSPLNATDRDGNSYPTASEVTRRIIFKGGALDAMVNGMRVFREAINGQIEDDESIAYNNSHQIFPTPFLVQAYQHTYAPNYTHALAHGGRDTNGIYPVAEGEVLEVVIQNVVGPGTESDMHSWHQHGQHFWYIASGYGRWSVDKAEAVLAKRTGKPYIRDTTMVWPAPSEFLPDDPENELHEGGFSGWTVWRERITTPGVWLVHCHLTPHMAIGMNSIFAFGIENLPPLPPEYAENYLYYNQSVPTEPVSYFSLVNQAGRGQRRLP